MANDPILGMSLDGKQLARLPANASNGDIITGINKIVDILNNVNKDIVAQGSITLTLNSESAKILTIPHNLGYKPRAFVNMDGTTVSLNGQTIVDVNLATPTYLDGSTSGGVVQFDSWIDYFTDETNLYIRFFGASSFTGSVDFSYFLTREAANRVAPTT